jgi:hypothetical protein
MSVGKYSPTVSTSYAIDQNWWKANGGGYQNGKDPGSDNDDEGYDSYGYSGLYGDGVDRAGYTEYEYLAGNCDEDGEFLGHDSYDRVKSNWSGIQLGAERVDTYPKD